MRLIKSILRAIWVVCLAVCLLLLCSSNALAADYTPTLPEGSQSYASAKNTQRIDVLMTPYGDQDRIFATPIAKLSDTRWHQPGGLESINKDLWRSERYKYIPTGRQVRSWITSVGVKNSFGYTQQNRAIQRSYPVGTRFDELLVNAKTNSVFEHRVREKGTDGWKSTVYYTNEEERPTGYTGLKVSCSSCHNEAGTGRYDGGFVPGGDTVLSDPLDWSAQVASTSPEPIQPPSPKVTPIPQPMPKPMVAPIIPQTTITPVQQFTVERRGLFGRRSVLVPVTGYQTVQTTTTTSNTQTFRSAPPTGVSSDRCAKGACAPTPSSRRGFFR